MRTPAERLRAAREQAGYRSAAEFARAIDMPEVTYRAYENGNRNIQMDAAQDIAPKLGVEWIWILTGENPPEFIDAGKEERLDTAGGKRRRTTKDRAQELTYAPVTIPSNSEMPRDLPVHGTAAGSVTGAFQLENAIIDYVRRPPGVLGAADVYALYIVGESMSPKHDDGDLVFVHPHRPIRVGDSVIIQVKNGEHEPGTSYVKRLVRRTADKLIVEQLNPPETIEFDRQQVTAVHKVLTMNELFGI